MVGIYGNGSEFIDFLCSPKGEEIMQENSISIHLETGNVFYDNFNTQESFYDFLLNQQDQKKKIIKKKTSFSHTFKRYLHQFLQSFDVREIDKYDLYSNKNSKFLMYRFNSYLESIHQPKKNNKTCQKDKR